MIRWGLTSGRTMSVLGWVQTMYQFFFRQAFQECAVYSFRVRVTLGLRSPILSSSTAQPKFCWLVLPLQYLPAPGCVPATYWRTAPHWIVRISNLLHTPRSPRPWMIFSFYLTFLLSKSCSCSSFSLALVFGTIPKNHLDIARIFGCLRTPQRKYEHVYTDFSPRNLIDYTRFVQQTRHAAVGVKYRGMCR